MINVKKNEKGERIKVKKIKKKKKLMCIAGESV